MMSIYFILFYLFLLYRLGYPEGIIGSEFTDVGLCQILLCLS